MQDELSTTPEETSAVPTRATGSESPVSPDPGEAESEATSAGNTSAETAVPAEPDSTDSTEPSTPGTRTALVRRRPSRRFSALRVIGLLVLVAVVLALTVGRQDSSYLELLPGPAPRIAVTGTGATTKAHLLLTTVKADPVSVDHYFWSSLMGKDKAFLPNSGVGSDAAEVTRMQESKRVAANVATAFLRNTPVRTTGVRVLEVVKGSPAEGLLTPGDLITAVDGSPLASDTDLVKRTNTPSSLRVSFTRQGQPHEVVLTPQRAGNTFRLGLQVATETQPVGNLDIPTGSIAGPSGGLMFALAFTDALSSGDLTSGRVVAGTGTINPDGTVGPIGGVEHKVQGAYKAGATVFLVDTRDAPAARAAAPANLVVVSVATYTDAMRYLCSTGATSSACSRLQG